MLGQAWMLELAASDDLIHAEGQWRAAALEAQELRERLEAVKNSGAGPK